MLLMGLAMVSTAQAVYVYWTYCADKYRSADSADICHPPCMANSTAQQSFHNCSSLQNDHTHHETCAVLLALKFLVQAIVLCVPKTCPNYFPAPNNQHISYKPSTNTSTALVLLPEHPEVTQGSLAIAWH